MVIDAAAAGVGRTPSPCRAAAGAGTFWPINTPTATLNTTISTNRVVEGAFMWVQSP